MKKMISLLLALVLAVSLFTTTPAAKTADKLLFGDGNSDTDINAADALIALRMAVGKQASDDTLFETMDVDMNHTINAVDALMILKYAVKKLERFPADPGTYLVDDDAQWNEMSMDEILDTIDGDTPASPIADYYALHSDGGMIYNPLSREMDPSDKTKYNTAKKTTGSLKLADGSTLTYSVPTKVTAYDMVPIEYTLQNGSNGFDPLYVEATTFERGNGSYYDLCLPGNVEVKLEYEGFVTATPNVTNRPYLSARVDDDLTGVQFPNYTLNDFVASDTLTPGQYIWFKFKVTNTGNTILEGDGNGTFCFQPTLINNETEKSVNTTNLYERLTEALYPGETTEMYVTFGALNAGNYTIKINSLVRNEEKNDAWNTKIWGGYTYGTATKDITIGDTVGTTIATPMKNTVVRDPVRDTWLHTYEEFTTSYDAWLNPRALNAKTTNVLYVQPAAWSDHLALKLMRGNGDTLKSVNIPLSVESDSITVNLNTTANNYIITDEGTKYPAMASQSMCDMRVNTQWPDALNKQLDELLDMKECGVNLVTTTEAFDIAAVGHQANTINDKQDANWFMCDVVRKLGMRLEGYTGYTYKESTTMTAAYWFSRESAYRNTVIKDPYNSTLLAKANGLRGMYQFLRWGKNFYLGAGGLPVFNTEDTRGWMRIDYNARCYLDEESLPAYRNWLKEKYGSIANLNNAWGDEFYSYTDFNQIDPDEGTTKDHSMANYVVSNSDVWEWGAAINDQDIFRTLQRTQNYKILLDTLKSYGAAKGGLPPVNATVGIRTEGANVTGVVPYDTNRSHLRHAYYSQRRCAIIPQILAKSGTVSMHSDYVTLPYSLKEWDMLVSSSTALGITNMPLLQANRMRDIAINARYGDPSYATYYNISDGNCLGAYINTQTSVFQAFKVIYEAGGIPGVLWEDYWCDGYVTETQQKEMKFFSQKIAQMMQTSEAKAWAETDVPDTAAVYDLALGEYSYNEEFLDAAIENALKNR